MSGEHPTETLPTVPGGHREDGGAHQGAYEHRRAGRFWSSRRVPAAIVAAVVLGVSGLFLYDVVSVRAGGAEMYWRRWLTRALEGQHLDGVWVMAGSAAAMAVGLWLIWLAATPGLRAVLPMRRHVPGVRAGLDRDAAALVLRDRAMEVSGVQSVRVRTKRHKVKARARSHFRPLDDVRSDLRAALADGVRDLGVAKAPSVAVRVRRPKKKD
ncbi:DUF6286 domain-containing protein [Streptomyces montanisoli]|uniref:DUF6286 domain-containing protein n=1 Tax=Streptomyces montanisoli TaxID=2798581 RepID=A0A940MF24_9ACTN|nr:DUF6286 domain-containing protein [Streptomyces montanisoli]MBP0458825.1 hypothetical protein [Streptomyces montanisoli]